MNDVLMFPRKRCFREKERTLHSHFESRTVKKQTLGMMMSFIFRRHNATPGRTRARDDGSNGGDGAWTRTRARARMRARAWMRAWAIDDAERDDDGDDEEE